MKSPEQILSLLAERRNQRGAFLARAEEIKNTYNGEITLPLPELDANERQMVANLVQGGIDQLSMRIASTWPNIWFPARRAGKAEANRARAKKDVVTAWHDLNRVPIKYRRRARWLVGYGTGPAMVTTVDREPLWRLCEPLSCYPAPGLDPDEIVPSDAINVYRRSRAWLEAAYPDQMRMLRKGEMTMFDVIEYVDAAEHVLIVQGAPASDDAYGMGKPDSGEDCVCLVRAPNRAQRPLVTTPGRITLDRTLGQFDGAIGMMHAKSMFMALGVIAQKRAIFPETWLVSQGQGVAEVVQDAEPMVSQVGIVSGVADMKIIHPEASVFTPNWMDRLEYEARQETATPAEWGGSGSQNIRTGRRGAQVLEAATDFPIQEAQVLLAAALEEEDKIAIAIAKAYQHKPVSLYVKGRGEVTYTASETFDSDVHDVTYAYAGADDNALNIQVGQKVGVGTLSKRSAMEFDPMVRDPESELDRIRVEKVEDAFMAAMQAIAQDPNAALQPGDLSRWAALVASDKLEPWDALAKVNAEIQERQVAQSQGQASPEEMQPGLAMPGAPGAPVPAIPEQGPSLGNLRNLLGDLRLGQATAPAEEVPIAGAPV